MCFPVHVRGCARLCWVLTSAACSVSLASLKCASSAVLPQQTEPISRQATQPSVKAPKAQAVDVAGGSMGPTAAFSHASNRRTADASTAKVWHMRHYLSAVHACVSLQLWQLRRWI